MLRTRPPVDARPRGPARTPLLAGGRGRREIVRRLTSGALLEVFVEYPTDVVLVPERGPPEFVFD
jgi:hypothetical protein